MRRQSIERPDGNQGIPPVLVTSIPKAGTNLVESTLRLFPGMKEMKGLSLNARLRYHPFNWIPVSRAEKCLVGVARPQEVTLSAVALALRFIRRQRYALAHLPFDERVARLTHRFGIRVIVVVRDPRDILVSSVHHALGRSNHFMHETIASYPTFESRARALLDGGVTLKGERYLGMSEQIRLMLGWSSSPEVLTIRFEDLVGARGGGSAEAQKTCLRALSQHLNAGLGEAELEEISGALYGMGRTFRRGAIGEWQAQFSPALSAEFDRVAGEALDLLGYR